MYALVSTIPDVDVLLGLAPEELAGTMLFLLRKREDHQFLLGNVLLELQNPYPGKPSYPAGRWSDVSLAIAEAWSWLQAQGLIVPVEGMGGSTGWCRLSRRAKKFESEAHFSDFRAARLLPRELLHSRIADPVWRAFMRGEFDVAVFQAMKAVEVAVREAGRFGNEMLGKALMQEAFKEGGPLADPRAEKAEQSGRMNLFVGAISSYKNPHSHRDVQLDDPAEAVELVMLANHLLRIVDSRRPAAP